MLIIGFSSLISIFVSAQNGENVYIHIVGERTYTRFGTQAMIAGIWHFINVTTDTQDFQELNLKFYSGESMPNEGERDESNYYEWQYNNDDEIPWTDVKKYGSREYINITRSVKYANNYSFCVGIKDTLPSQPKFYNENWTLEVYLDDSRIHTENVVVEKPTSGLAKSHGDIILFNVDPFTKMNATGHDFFRIENTGNLPLSINVDYNYYNDIIKYSVNEIVTANNSMKFDPIIIHSESWPPGIKDIEGTIKGEIPNNLIIPVGTVTFGTSFGIDAPILRVVAAHANYEIEEFKKENGTITFQYQKTMKMSENEIKDIKVYISGDGIINFDIKSEDLTILKVFSNDNEVNAPFLISSTDTSEHIVTIRIKATKETNNANLRYIVEINGEIYEYDTAITVNPPQASHEGIIKLDLLLIIVIILIICLVIGYMVNTHLKYSRR